MFLKRHSNDVLVLFDESQKDLLVLSLVKKDRREIMAQTTICIRIDADLKKDFEKFCDSIGMSMSTAVNIFIKKSVGEQRIPFEITAKRNSEKS